MKDIVYGVYGGWFLSSSRCLERREATKGVRQGHLVARAEKPAWLAVGVVERDKMGARWMKRTPSAVGRRQAKRVWLDKHGDRRSGETPRPSAESTLLSRPLVSALLPLSSCKAMAPTVTIIYELHPPSDTPTPPSLTASQTLQYPVSSEPITSHKAYYENLRAEVLQAKSVLGEQLTAWRDAVGKREDNKEAKIPKKNEEDEEDEDEEQE